jgi:hypothetical protein
MTNGLTVRSPGGNPESIRGAWGCFSLALSLMYSLVFIGILWEISNEYRFSNESQ